VIVILLLKLRFRGAQYVSYVRFFVSRDLLNGGRSAGMAEGLCEIERLASM
jgi:hypothetical protein